MRKVFITGATGVVGSALIKELLNETSDIMYLLIRSQQNTSAIDRCLKVLRFIQGNNFDNSLAQKLLQTRIVILDGDITKPQFGLKQDQYFELESNVEHIFHCAASVELHDQLEVAQRNSVFPTRLILDLQARIRQQRPCIVEYVSTVGVLGKLNKPLTEIRLLEPRQFHNSYEQSKAEAEELIYKAIDEGAPIVIHRPSMVVGDSLNGEIIHYQIFYFILRFITGQFTNGLIPNVKGLRLDTIPCDIVAKVLVASSLNKTSKGAILHCCSGPQNSISLSDLQRMALKISADRPVPSMKLPLSWLKLYVFLGKTLTSLRAPFHLQQPTEPNRKRKRYLVFESILDYARGNQIFDNMLSRSVVHEWGIEIPSPINYLPQVLRRYTEEGFLK